MLAGSGTIEPRISVSVVPYDLFESKKNSNPQFYLTNGTNLDSVFYAESFGTLLDLR